MAKKGSRKGRDRKGVAKEGRGRKENVKEGIGMKEVVNERRKEGKGKERNRKEKVKEGIGLKEVAKEAKGLVEVITREWRRKRKGELVILPELILGQWSGEGELVIL